MSISSEAVVLLTLAYSDQFSFPLNKVEICQRLVKTSLSRNTLRKILISLEKMKLVESQDQFWKLSNGQAQAKVRLEREQYSQRKWCEVHELVESISWIPWIKGIAVTGSLAVNNVIDDDDIDLMLVVAPQRLWLSRVLVFLSALWAGKRRTWQGNEANSWCFNLWLDENSLKLPGKKRNLYSAYEVCQAKWVFPTSSGQVDRASVEKRFLQENFWVKRLLPNFYKSTSSVPPVVNKPELLLPQGIFSGFAIHLMSLLNLIVFRVQYLYMYPHMSREKVSLGSAYFHPRSTRGHIYKGWKYALKQLQSRQQRVVLVTGVFDLFHQEHQNFLRKAKAEGDLLVVGIETDERVRKNKGVDRPIDDQQQRLQQLQLFPVVDLAFVLPAEFDTDEEHLALLKLIKPQVLAVSSHTPYLKKKQQLMKKIDGEVKVVYEQNLKVSTTEILA